MYLLHFVNFKTKESEKSVCIDSDIIVDVVVVSVFSFSFCDTFFSFKL